MSLVRGFARIFILKITILLTIAAVARSATAQQIPGDVKKQLEENAAAMNGLELGVLVENKALMSASKLPAKLKYIASPEFLAFKEEHLIRIDSKRFFQRATDDFNGSSERAYDGKTMFSGSPDQDGEQSLLAITNEELSEQKQQIKKLRVKHFYWPYFQDAGYHLPETSKELGSSTDSLVLWLEKQGRVIHWKSSGEFIDVGIEAPGPWQAKNKRRYRFVLDPSLGYAMREKWVETVQGKLISHTVCDEFEQIDGKKLWLPKVCSTFIHAVENVPSFKSSKPMYVKMSMLTAVERRSFSTDDFRLWYKTPGGMIFDYTAEGATATDPIVSHVPGKLPSMAEGLLRKPIFWLLVNALILGCLALVIRARRARGKT